MKGNSVRIAALSAVVFSAVVAFQNCTKSVTFDSRSRGQTGLSNAGNGEGYTGKSDLFVARDPEGLCGDVSRIRGKIERLTGGGQTQYLLTKVDCRDVNPPRLVAVESEFGNDGAGKPLQIVYQSQAYEREGPVSLAANFRLFCTSEAPITQELPSDALSGGTSTALAPSGMGAWVVKACDLSGACQVRKNCFFDGNGGFAYSGDNDCRTYATPFAAGVGATNFSGNGRFLPSCFVIPK